eukprot:CAMPEP_0175174864 /NCGR_PEP_ID=MMETSP0087-20121206/32881_1 /TAXON_ID=136419 /ORGANISM="Unknown Unknown, Strain D1" /LENGTH=434 /DNA_ID=CAMNT_0016466405 /DNA_START=23 /DNA_END=1326 /DNA_ORIENTATION=-
MKLLVLVVAAWNTCAQFLQPGGAASSTYNAYNPAAPFYNSHSYSANNYNSYNPYAQYNYIPFSNNVGYNVNTNSYNSYNSYNPPFPNNYNTPAAAPTPTLQQAVGSLCGASGCTVYNAVYNTQTVTPAAPTPHAVAPTAKPATFPPSHAGAYAVPQTYYATATYNAQQHTYNNVACSTRPCAVYNAVYNTYIVHNPTNKTFTAPAATAPPTTKPLPFAIAGQIAFNPNNVPTPVGATTVNTTAANSTNTTNTTNTKPPAPFSVYIPPPTPANTYYNVPNNYYYNPAAQVNVNQNFYNVYNSYSTHNPLVYNALYNTPQYAPAPPIAPTAPAQPTKPWPKTPVKPAATPPPTTPPTPIPPFYTQYAQGNSPALNVYNSQYQPYSPYAPTYNAGYNVNSATFTQSGTYVAGNTATPNIATTPQYANFWPVSFNGRR